MSRPGPRPGAGPFTRPGRSGGPSGGGSCEVPLDPSDNRRTTSAADSSPDSEEKGWVEAARAGSHEAFRWLMDRHQDRVFGIALRLMRDREEALEAAQDAFLKAFRGLERFEQRSRFSTWLYRIAVNVCYDRLGRRGRPGEVGLDELLEKGVEPAAGANWEAGDSIETTQGESELERALAGLDDLYRLPFVLRQIEERSYDEIAAILGITVTNAKVRVHRAREMLITRLKSRGVL